MGIYIIRAQSELVVAVKYALQISKGSRGNAGDETRDDEVKVI